MKTTMTMTPILCLLDFTKSFLVETDASGHAMGSILTGSNLPLAYFSKVFPPSLQVASTYVKELTAIIEAVKKWWKYLFGKHFTIITDHDNLTLLLLQMVQTLAQQKFICNLMGYKLMIVCQKGKDNTIPNALSRHDETIFSLISSPIFYILQWIKIARDGDIFYKEVWSFILVAQHPSLDFLFIKISLFMTIGS